MNIEVTMCYSQLMSMLLQPEEFSKAVIHFTSSSPNVEHEGMNGYMETVVKFEVKSLMDFSKIYEKSYTFPSDRPEWYRKVRDGMLSYQEY